MKKLFLKKPDERGQGLVEYALILVLVAIVVIGVLLVLGPTVSEVYCEVVNVLQPGECGAITSVTAVRDGNGHGNTVVVTITVSEPAKVTATWPGGSGSTNCSGSCTITITTDDGGRVRVKDDMGGVMSAPYSEKI
jgi:pilus assembly protein Flp/PilA